MYIIGAINRYTHSLLIDTGPVQLVQLQHWQNYHIFHRSLDVGMLGNTGAHTNNMPTDRSECHHINLIHEMLSEPGRKPVTGECVLCVLCVCVCVGGKFKIQNVPGTHAHTTHLHSSRIFYAFELYECDNLMRKLCEPMETRMGYV